jgi:hypothetical protein
LKWYHLLSPLIYNLNYNTIFYIFIFFATAVAWMPLAGAGISFCVPKKKPKRQIRGQAPLFIPRLPVASFRFALLRDNATGYKFFAFGYRFAPALGTAVLLSKTLPKSGGGGLFLYWWVSPKVQEGA